MARIRKKLWEVYKRVSHKIEEFNELAQLPKELRRRFSVEIPSDSWGTLEYDMHGDRRYSFEAVLWDKSDFYERRQHTIHISRSAVNSMEVPQIAENITSEIMHLLQTRREFIQKFLEKIRQYDLYLVHGMSPMPRAARMQMGRYIPEELRKSIFVWDRRNSRSPVMSFGWFSDFDWDHMTVRAMPYLWQVIPGMRYRYRCCDHWYIEASSHGTGFRFYIKFDIEYTSDHIDDLLACMVGRPLTEEQRNRFWQDAGFSTLRCA